MESKAERMIQLDFRKCAINRQIFNCIKYPYYYAGIYVHLYTKSGEIFDEIQKIIESCLLKEYLDEYPYRKGMEETKIIFNNGSSIKIVRGTEMSRGQKFHDIIYDHLIEDEIVHNVLIPSHVPYFDYSVDPPVRDNSRYFYKIVECDL